VKPLHVTLVADQEYVLISTLLRVTKFKIREWNFIALRYHRATYELDTLYPEL
jgi:hypothetical protein